MENFGNISRKLMEIIEDKLKINFRMSFDDFMKIWGEVDICHLTCDAFSGELMETDND